MTNLILRRCAFTLAAFTLTVVGVVKAGGWLIDQLNQASEEE